MQNNNSFEFYGSRNTLYICCFFLFYPFTPVPPPGFLRVSPFFFLFFCFPGSSGFGGALRGAMAKFGGTVGARRPHLGGGGEHRGAGYRKAADLNQT